MAEGVFSFQIVPLVSEGDPLNGRSFQFAGAEIQQRYAAECSNCSRMQGIGSLVGFFDSLNFL